MSWMCSWVAVQAPKADVLSVLQVVEWGPRTIPGEGNYKLCCDEKPGGWLVVFSEDLNWASEKRVLELSRLGLTVGLQFEDQVEMTCIAIGARDGELIWRVAHDVEADGGLDVSGEPPAALAEIRKVHSGDVDDAYEIPQDLAKAVCGYRADEDEAFFQALKTEAGNRPDKPGFFARLFGAR